MDRRILDEEITRRIAKAQKAIVDFQQNIVADPQHALVWYAEDAFMACARETQYLVVQNNLEADTLADAIRLAQDDLICSAQRFEASSSLGSNVMGRCRVRALSEVLELLQQGQEEVEQAA